MSDEIDNGQPKTGQRRKGRRKPRNGEIGIRYGDRNFLIVPGQGLIARNGDWHLVAVPDWDRPGWWNFKLYNDFDKKKNLYNLSVNSTGVHERRDAKILNEYHPGVIPWVAEKAREYIDGKLIIKKELGERIKYSNKAGWRKLSKKGD